MILLVEFLDVPPHFGFTAFPSVRGTGTEVSVARFEAFVGPFVSLNHLSTPVYI